MMRNIQQQILQYLDDKPISLRTLVAIIVIVFANLVVMFTVSIESWYLPTFIVTSLFFLRVFVLYKNKSNSHKKEFQIEFLEEKMKEIENDIQYHNKKIEKLIEEKEGLKKSIN